MIYPAPTTPIAPTIARGTFLQSVPASASKPPHLVVSFPNTNYQLHLIPAGPISAEVGKRILGTIRAQARRVDVVDTGGKYVEPVFGHPRRVQGRIVETNQNDGTITVDAGMPIECRLTDRRQQPGDFQLGQLVSFDVLDGATFTQQR